MRFPFRVPRVTRYFSFCFMGSLELGREVIGWSQAFPEKTPNPNWAFYHKSYGKCEILTKI